MTEEYISKFEETLRKGIFAVTAEVSSPDAPSPTTLIKRAKMLAPYCDALNITDSPSANPHISSLAASAILVDNDMEPIMGISCRDRNRIAMQADILGANALGIKNMLCLTGDGVSSGDHPESKAVFDLDSTNLISIASAMAKNGEFHSGRKLESAPKLFLGGATNPFVPPFEFRPHMLLKKHQAGAHFFQSQYCFEIEPLKSFMDDVLTLTDGNPPPILVGVGPLPSARTARWMRKNVPGVVIPDTIIDAIDSKSREDQPKLGLEIAIKLVDSIKQVPGVAGIHIMAYKWEGAVKDIVEGNSLRQNIIAGR